MASRIAQREEARARREAEEQAAAAAAARKRRLTMLAGLAAGAVAVVALVVLLAGGGTKKHTTLKAGQAPTGAATVTKEFAGIPQSGLTLGSPKAPVTLIEFADLKCPICQEYSLNVLPTLIQRYVRTGKVKMEFRNMAFVGETANPGDSPAAARMNMAAGLQNHLWQFAELFYLNQQDENTRYVSDSFVRRLASAVPGLDAAKALAQRSNPQVQQWLLAAQTQYATPAYQFSGTPSFLLEGSGETPTPLNWQSLTVPQFTGPIDALLRGS